MVIDSPALASLVGGRTQKVMENERRPKICKKQDNQIPRERKCKSKKDSLLALLQCKKQSLWLWSRKNSIAKLAPRLQQKLATDCLTICIRRRMLILRLNLFLVKVPHGRPPSLNCFTIAQWTNTCSGIQEGLIMKFDFKLPFRITKFNFELPFPLQKLNIIVRKYNMDFPSFILPASL